MGNTINRQFEVEGSLSEPEARNTNLFVDTEFFNGPLKLPQE